MDLKSNNTNQPNSDDIQIIEEKISKVNGDIAVKKYQKGKLLGKGGFAKCFEVTNMETKKILAAKIIPKNSLVKSRARQKLISEIKIHKSLHHSNVVQFEHVFEDHENVYIMLELCPNNTLNELIKRRKRLTEIEVQCYVIQIINSLLYLHQNRVIHRDLKLGNLFMGEKLEIKLGDFGLATKLEFDGEKKRTICGTPNYIAPEILDGKTGHSYEVDVWSLGVVIYTLIIGKPPFETPDVKTTYKKIKQNNYSFPEHVPISDNAKNLITKILNLDPARRPTLDEIMNHPYLTSSGPIPKTMPLSTLACPPNEKTLKQQYQTQSPIKQNDQQQGRMLETAPADKQRTNLSKERPNVMSTDKVNSFKPNTPMEIVSATGSMKFASTNNINNQAFISSTTNTNFQSNKEIRPFSQKSETKPGTTNSIKNLPSSQAFSQTNFHTIQSMNTMGKTDAFNQPGSMKQFASGIGSSNQTGGINGSQAGEVWVKSWVDYSSKYGLGYILSNGSSGVFFNDSTKIILDANGNNFEYMERKQNERQDIIMQYSLAEFPKELQKKVTLLQHFRSYLEGSEKTVLSNIQSQPQMDKLVQDNLQQFLKSKNMVYVKKWMKTRHAIMFRLSNKVVQVNFTDKTEILLSSENKMVTYVNKKGERSNYPLATALESTNVEMSKRLKYTKEILTHMLNANQKTQQNKLEGGTGTDQPLQLDQY